VIQSSGLIPHYQTEREGQERIENLNELVNAAAAFVAEEGYVADAPGTQGEAEVALPSPLAGFLSHASLEAGENQAEAGQDALQLMTVHSAKGLEFFAVFITGLEEGLFPHENSLTEADGLEEERRLMRRDPRARGGLHQPLSRFCTGNAPASSRASCRSCPTTRSSG
jgi:DNA helicase-2/ATP-dependent DNA helicase PcrA